MKHLPIFELNGRPVYFGDILHIAPEYYSAAGAQAKAERFYGCSVQMRSKNGAVPTVPVEALSWEPHPEVVALETMREAGIRRPSYRDLEVWKKAMAYAQKARSPS